jgi:hypothetical protein
MSNLIDDFNFWTSDVLIRTSQSRKLFGQVNLESYLPKGTSLKIQFIWPSNFRGEEF